MRAHLAGVSSQCKWEPAWSALYPHIAKPTDSNERKAERAVWLLENGVSCAKLKMSSAACHGCEDNPLGSDATAEDGELITQWWPDIQLTDRLFAAASLNLLRLADLTAEELDLLSIFQAEVRRAENQPR